MIFLLADILSYISTKLFLSFLHELSRQAMMELLLAFARKCAWQGQEEQSTTFELCLKAF
jgi:hypothetical protein